MLNRTRKQNGVILFLALIILMVLMVGGLALFRSVDSGVMLAGNMAMQRSAVRSADAAATAAMAWLNNPVNNTTLNATGYQAAGLLNQKPATQSWSDFWDVLAGQITPVEITTDAAGNTASYIIQRMCDGTGAPYSVGPPPVSCVRAPDGGSSSSMGAGTVALVIPSGTYYQIYIRTTAARGLTSYVQATVFM